MQVINLETNQDITKQFEAKKLTKPQIMLRLAKYRRLNNKKSNKKKRK